MKTVSARRPRAKSVQPVTWVYEPHTPGVGTLEITRGESLAHYYVSESTPDPEAAPGRHFRLRKIGEASLYDCHLADLPELSACDCADHTFAEKPHQCKHLLALRAVVESGQIDEEREPVPAELCDCWDCFVYREKPGYQCPRSGVQTSAPTPAPTPEPVEPGPEPLTTPCPTCLTVCELVPVRSRSYPHEIRCVECQRRAEGCE